MATPAAVLNTGAKVPLVGFGTWKAEPGRVGEAVRTALEAGYRHIDCAAVYGNEKEIGQVFKEIFSSGKVKRSDVFVTSKLWNTCHKKEHVIEACKQTLKDLQLDYLDLYLIHWPCAFEFAGLPITEENTIPKNKKGEIAFAKVPLQETWKAMEELQKQGLVKAIGVSNYRIVELLDLLSYCEIVPAVNQIEVHPYNQRKDLKDGKEGPLQDSVVRSISEKLGKTPAQVLLAWGLQRGTSVIPKSVTPTRIKENLNCTFKLDSEVVKQIDQLERGQVVCDMREYWGFPIDA
ncbi:Aldose reductase A [Galdieria sulphuraria]|nr:Aldose reductase A [Galdieria sulphuraria]